MPSATALVAQPEVTRLLMQHMGISVRWRRGEPREPAQRDEIRIIFLNTATRSAHSALALGATPVRFPGERLVWIHVPSARSAVAIVSSRAGIRHGGGSDGSDDFSVRLLGLALARVTVHELIHVLAPSLPHGHGLMASRLTPELLTASTIPVDVEIGVSVRRAVLEATPPVTPADERLAGGADPGGTTSRTSSRNR